MPYGLEVYNDSYIYQIDGNSKNLSLIAKGRTSPANGPDGKFPFAYGSYGGNNMFGSKSAFTSNSAPIVVFRPVEGPAALIGVVNKSGNIWEVFAFSNVAANIDWWAFADSPGSGGHGQGLEVFDASGNVVFYSQYSALKIRGVWQAVNGASPVYGGNMAYFVNGTSLLSLGGVFGSEIGVLAMDPSAGFGGSVSLSYRLCYTTLGEPRYDLAERVRQSLSIIAVDVTGL